MYGGCEYLLGTVWLVEQTDVPCRIPRTHAPLPGFHFMRRSVVEKTRDARVNRALYGVDVSTALDYAAPVLEKCNARAADAQLTHRLNCQCHFISVSRDHLSQETYLTPGRPRASGMRQPSPGSTGIS